MAAFDDWWKFAQHEQVGYSTKGIAHHGWDAAIKFMEGVQTQANNNARDEIVLCAARRPCQFQDDIKCTTKSACTEQRKTSPVA